LIFKLKSLETPLSRVDFESKTQPEGWVYQKTQI